MTKIRTFILLTCLVSVLSCSKNSGDNNNSNKTAEQRLQELKSDFVVEPQIARILTDKAPYRWKKELVAKSDTKVRFVVKGGAEPIKVEVSEGGGNVSGLEYSSSKFTGLTILKFTDKDNRVGHAVVEVAEPPSLNLDPEMALAPCQQTELKTNGGFPPFKYEVTSGNAELLKDPWRVKVPKDGKEFSVVVTDSQNNKETTKVDTSRSYVWRSAANLCFGDNGKLKFPETKIPMEKVRDRNFLSFVPAAVKSDIGKSRLYVVGTQIINNDMVGTGFHVDGGLLFGKKLEAYSKYEMKATIRAYDADGNPDSKFGTAGVFTLPSDKNEITKAEAVAVQSDGKIVVGGVSFREDGARYFLVRLKPGGSLDESFGSAGVVMSKVMIQLPYKIISGLFGVGYQDRPVQVKKILFPKSGARILVQVDYLSPRQNGLSYSSLSGVMAFNQNGTYDKTFGDNGRIISSSEDLNVGTIRDVTQTSDDSILVLYSTGFEVMARIRSYGSDGKLNATFGRTGEILVKDPYWGKRPRDMTNEQYKKEFVHQYVDSGDLFDRVGFRSIVSGPGGSILLMGDAEMHEDVSGKSSKRTVVCALGKEQDGSYVAKWKFGRNSDAYIVAVTASDGGKIRNSKSDRDTSEYWSQRMVMGSALYSSSSNDRSFGVSVAGVDYNQYIKNYLGLNDPDHTIMGGDKEEFLMDISLDESENSGSDSRQPRMRINVLTDGGLYQYLAN